MVRAPTTPSTPTTAPTSAGRTGGWCGRGPGRRPGLRRGRRSAARAGAVSPRPSSETGSAVTFPASRSRRRKPTASDPRSRRREVACRPGPSHRQSQWNPTWDRCADRGPTGNQSDATAAVTPATAARPRHSPHGWRQRARDIGHRDMPMARRMRASSPTTARRSGQHLGHEHAPATALARAEQEAARITPPPAWC